MFIALQVQTTPDSAGNRKGGFIIYEVKNGDNPPTYQSLGFAAYSNPDEQVTALGELKDDTLVLPGVTITVAQYVALLRAEETRVEALRAVESKLRNQRYRSFT